MKKIAITQSNYIPWMGYFEMINYVDQFIFFDETQFTRRDWRNRNKLLCEGKTKWLTIPLKTKGNYYKKISEMNVYDDNWKKEHLKKIFSYYGKLSNFNKNFNKIQKIYTNCSKSRLTEINKHFIKEISKLLKIKSDFQDSDNYKIRNSKNASERLLEICIAAKADIYVSGPSAKNYLDIDLFKKHNVKIEWFKYVYSKHYFQKNREILINNLSIIDYILRFGLDKKIFNLN